MLTRVHSVALVGLEANLIEVEVDISTGFPSFTIVGLADTAIQESKERIRTAIKRANISFPDVKVVVNLAPADIRKAGPSYDLPIALAILAAHGDITIPTEDMLCIGELSLDGRVRSVHGVLAATLLARRLGYSTIIVPATNADEASLVPGITVLPVNTLQEVIHHFQKDSDFTLTTSRHKPPASKRPSTVYDFAHIRGHGVVKRAMEIVAAGGHHMLLYGPPGSGKTILAKTLLSILPSMTTDEILEVTNMYSVAGLLDQHVSYISERPFRSPHHSASMAAIVGGGKLPRPGEISLAHHGVLYFDELPEFPRGVLEALRQPLEDRLVTVARAETTVTYPAHCMFIGSLNPCPCGYYGDDDKECTCTPIQITKYQKKLSGPLLDRMDVSCYVPRISFSALQTNDHSESSNTIFARVEKARAIQRERFHGLGVLSNAFMTNQLIEQHCVLGEQEKSLMRNAMRTMQLSPRAYFRTLRVARTIADLRGDTNINAAHIGEALQFRQLSFLQ